MEAAAAAELEALVRLAAGLLVPCVALLCCLTGLLWLRRPSPAWPHPRRRRRQPPTPPPWPLGSGGGGGLQAAASRVAGGSAGLGRPQPRCLCGWGQPWLGPASAAASSSSPSSAASSDLDRHPMLVPPNSPATGSWLARQDIHEGGFRRQPPSAQREAPSGRPAFPARPHPSPLEYGSSIRRGEQRTQLSSANLTASQGPGLDSDFGASAGVSLRIMSSDSEESPTAPMLHPQQLGRFEWDYYDPSYKKSPPLQRHLPCVCSKQYWL